MAGYENRHIWQTNTLILKTRKHLFASLRSMADRWMKFSFPYMKSTPLFTTIEEVSLKMPRQRFLNDNDSIEFITCYLIGPCSPQWKGQFRWCGEPGAMSCTGQGLSWFRWWGQEAQRCFMFHISARPELRLSCSKEMKVSLIMVLNAGCYYYLRFTRCVCSLTPFPKIYCV